MIKSVLYEAQLGTTIQDFIPKLIKKAIRLKRPIKALFNDTLLKVKPDSTYEEVYKQYFKEDCHLPPRDINGELFKIKKPLGK